MTIVEFLKARLDEDEAAALRWPETERSWKPVGTRNLRYDNRRGEQVGAVDVSGNAWEWWERIYVKRDIDGLTGHVARWDPARVLREINAKRALLRAHPFEPYADEPSEGFCAECQRGGSAGVWPCPTVRIMSAVYDDHPDYRTEWAP